jgi:hypothetical protein
VRLRLESPDKSTMRIVVKERYALYWMKMALLSDASLADEYVKTHGLEEVRPACDIIFGVRYS